MQNAANCFEFNATCFYFLQNHSAFCAIRHQGKYAAKHSTDELDIPPLRDMYIVLQKLVMENEKLHKKIADLEKLTHKEKKRISLVDWLNTNKTPKIDFVDWVKKINVTQSDFHRILTVLQYLQ